MLENHYCLDVGVAWCVFMSQLKLEFSRIADRPSTNCNSNVFQDELEFQIQLDISTCKLKFWFLLV